MLFMALKKKIYILILIFSVCTVIPSNVRAEDLSQVNFKNLRGSWNLLYGNDYGYSFKFYKNYRAVVILYLNSSSIIFKGVYNIESNDTIRINISEMKREESVKNLNIRSGFVKAKSSHFIFNIHLTASGGKRNLELRPVKIFIDGSDSEGYFEPFIKLDYTGK